MVPKKAKSGRQTIAQKFKIQKRTKEHHRKLKKEGNRAKKAGFGTHLKNKKKDPGIPNDYPHKAELLKQIERAKVALEERKEAQKEARKDARKTALAERRGLGAQAGMVSASASLPGLVEAQATRAAAFNAAAEVATTLAAAAEGTAKSQTGGEGQASRRAYLKELRKVLETADVVLQVLDARDPMGSRSLAVEAAVTAQPDKKLVLVLNKVDLVPKEVTAGWLAVLRRSFPTVAFKASTQHTVGRTAPSALLASAEQADEAALSRSTAVGVDSLMHVLKNYGRADHGSGGGAKTKAHISVGVVGYPNVGKSSLVNSLKGRNVVGTSAVAGFTKAMAEVSLDKHVTLLDSPGVVFSDGPDAQLRNCLNPEDLPDPQAAVGAMLRRVAPEQLMQLYALPRFPAGDADAFLSLAARRLGKVKRGGVPDKDAAAVAVLRDWNSGALKYFTPAPADDAHLLGMEAPSLVAGFGAAFDPAAMMATDALVLDAATAGYAAAASGGGGVGMVALAQVGAGTGTLAAADDGGGGASGMGDSDAEGSSDGFEDEMSGSEEEEEEEAEAPVPPPRAASAKGGKAKGGKVSLFDDPLRDLSVGSADARRAHKSALKKAQKDKRRGGRGMDEDNNPGF